MPRDLSFFLINYFFLTVFSLKSAVQVIKMNNIFFKHNFLNRFNVCYFIKSFEAIKPFKEKTKISLYEYATIKDLKINYQP